MAPQLTPASYLAINDAAEAFAGTFGTVPPQFSVGAVDESGRATVSIEVRVSVADLNAWTGALEVVAKSDRPWPVVVGANHDGGDE